MKNKRFASLFLITLQVMCGMLWISTAHASLQAYEPFNYTSGGQVNTTVAAPTGTPNQGVGTGGGFTGNWGGGAASVNAFGFTYPSLPTAARSILNIGANNVWENLATAAPTTGSTWVSFLYAQPGGDGGGNRHGIFIEDSTGTGVMFSYHQSTGVAGLPCLMKMSGTTTLGTELTPDSSTLQTYVNTNLFVMEFVYTGGVVTTIRFYTNPTAGQSTVPGSPDFTVTTGLPTIGGIKIFGMYDASGPINIMSDEWRVGTSFADVVGVSAIAVTTSITSPTNTQTVSKFSLPITASASVFPGTITNVDFYVAGSKVGRVTNSPYTFTATGLTAGSNALTAVAFDSSGNTATSSVVNVFAVDQKPSVSITNPAASSQFLTGSGVSIGASASDDGGVTNVGFYVDGSLVGSSTSTPYSTVWTGTSGAHSLTAVAYDTAGQTTTSSVVSVTGVLPTTSITSPTNTQSVSVFGMTVTANATVAVGTITNVSLFVDSTFYTNKTASPFTFSVTGLSAGAHALQDIAVDSNGNSVTSTVVNVTAVDLPPSVTVTNPVNAALILTGTTVALGASASDDVGVTNVSFLVDGIVVGNSTASPFSTPWVATSGGHAITAIAFDTIGQSKTSSVVSVTGTLPATAITSPTNTQSVSIFGVTVTANATVSPGAITNVALYLDSVVVSNKTALPFTFALSSLTLGAHTLNTVATDSNGNSVTSLVVNVTAADLAPSVTITNPASGSSILAGTSVTLGASATDDSSVTNVSFFVDGSFLGRSASSPYSTSWTAATGSHSLTAVANDNAGQSTTSSVVSVTGVLNFNAYEPFNYTTGTFASGTATTGTGFTGNWVGSASGTIISGLTYTSLPTGNNALQFNGSYMFENFSGVSTNNIWVSVLYQQAGDNGGNRSGFLLEDSTGNGIMLSYNQSTGTQGNPCLMPMTGTNTQGTQYSTKSGTLRTYATPNLYVLKLTYTAGALTSVTVYTDPTANQSTVPSADFTVSGITGVGVISRCGVSSPSAMNVIIDEVRMCTTFAAAVGVSAPSAPGSFTATPTNAQVNLSWTASTNGSPTGYNIKRSTSSGVETTVASVAGTSYADTNVSNGTTYFYVVAGTNGAGEGSVSTEVSATPVAPPGQVLGLTATPGVNQVTLNWTATSGATGYRVLRGTSTGVYSVTNSTGANSYVDATAVGGTTYFYAVQATNAGGAGPLSSETNALPAVAIPNAPASVTATPTNSQVGLTWSVGTGAISYNVKRTSTSGSNYVTISTAGAVTGTSYTDTTAVNGSIYYYVVSSTNGSGESTNSLEATAAMPPATPAGLGATPGANQVSLSWTASTGLSAATSYNVKRSTNSGSGYVTISSPGAVTGTSYNDTTAISGTTYYYVVSGVNASGQGNNSAQTSATPSGVPQAPTGVTVTTNYTSLTLNWTAALGAPTGYNVKRSTSSGAETTLPAGTNVSGTSFTDTNLSTGVTYFYKISAINGDGEGADSAEVSGAAPGSPSAYEPFNYGTLNNGDATTATGFTGNWAITNGDTIVSGLTYPNLFTTNSALQVTSGNQYEKLSIPLFSGTIYISLLYSQNGDNGGNRAGFELLNNSGNGVMLAYHQFGGTAGLPSIDAITGYNNVGSELGVSSTAQNYAGPNMYVIRLDYSTAGVLTNLAVYTNPTVGQSTPAPDFSVTSGLSGIGTITTLGLHVGIPTTVDEWRVGTTFSSVVVGKAAAPVSLSSSPNPAASGATVTYTATVTNTATGTVDFSTNGVVFGTVTLSSGVAVLATNVLTVHGTNIVTATYSGDANFIGGAASVAQIIDTAPTANADSFTRPSGFSMKISISSLLSNDTDADSDTIQFVSVSPTTTNGSALSTDATFVYVPTNSVADAFTYTIRDSLGSTGVGTVTLSISTNTSSGQVTTVTSSPSNAVATFYGIPGVNYVVQRATNVTFSAGVSNFPSTTAPTNGVFGVTDDFGDLGTVPSSAFYRLMVP